MVQRPVQWRNVVSFSQGQFMQQAYVMKTDPISPPQKEKFLAEEIS